MVGASQVVFLTISRLIINYWAHLNCKANAYFDIYMLFIFIFLMTYPGMLKSQVIFE